MIEENLYRLLFETSGQGMVLRQGEKIILVNQSFADMVGYSIDELLDFSMEQAFNLIHPLDREEALARFHDLVSGKELPKKYIYRFLRRNGKTGWWSAVVSTIEYQGQPAVLGIYDDITERKDAEESVMRGRKLLAATLDVLPVGVCLNDETGHYRMMNDAYCAIYEYEREEMLGQHYSVIMPPDQIALANAHYARLLSGDVGIPVERKRQRKDGSIVYIEAANALVEDADGKKMVITTVRDITERKQAETALRESDERYQAFISHSFEAIYRTEFDHPIDISLPIETQIDLIYENAYMAECNQALADMYHLQSVDAMIGVRLLDAHGGKENPINRAAFRKLIEGGYKSSNDETAEFDANGNPVWFLSNTIGIVKNGYLVRLWGTSIDITERKRGDEIIRLRLRLFEYAATHSLIELMQKALDEIGELTGSPIGFYHFVGEDQKSLSLQAWSTRTLKEFCLAEGQGMHYPIEKAGVWTDCIYQRKPVIHNEYAALPHRKGLPDGHAELVRELVVPILRNDRVVAILGVGNKPSHYNEQDIELVSYIADLVWSIVEQKKADEQIRELNAKLEHLAMTDELTGLMNRRSFLIQCEKEISRSQRHKIPLSLLMLDIDRFKTINDKYGHDMGDFVLQRFSRILVENLREIDIVARMGGEEFSVLLPNTVVKDAVKLAERIRLAVEQESYQIQNQKISMTVSIGVASYDKNTSDLETIIKHADRSMYQAKNQGRNRVVFLE